jgi:hypothetical protein
MEEVVEPPAKKGKRVNFPWTASREFTFVNYILLEKGHLKTDTNMVDKFNAISFKLRVDSAFIGRDFLDGAALKKKWDRMSSLVDAKYGISSEGANLSGLEEEPSEVEKLILDLLKERFDTKKAKDEQSLKDKIRNEKMLTHEKTMLKRQEKGNDEVIIVDEVVSDCSEDGTEGSNIPTKPKQRKNNCGPPEMLEFEKQIVEALKEDPRILELEIEERRRKIEDANSDRAFYREMESRRFESEQRVATERARYEMEKAKADMERSKADQAMAASQLRMMEFFAQQMNK